MFLMYNPNFTFLRMIPFFSFFLPHIFAKQQWRKAQIEIHQSDKRNNAQAISPDPNPVGMQSRSKNIIHSIPCKTNRHQANY